MPQIQLTPAERREHRANAHHLDPVVLVGGDGLTPAVKKEIDAALNAHGLIKVRVFGDDRAARELMYQELADMACNKITAAITIPISTKETAEPSGQSRTTRYSC